MSNKTIWQSFSFFNSAPSVQDYLLNCYKKLGINDAEIKSYNNCYPFIYYLEHGKNFYELSIKSPLSIQPILLFYGMVQLLKACLLTVDPQYPETTTVLAHGVSTRKRKKKDYDFLQDEVKIQKNGLFPHFSAKMFHVKHLEANKFTMRELLNRIPELDDVFSLHKQPLNHYEIGISNGKSFFIPNKLLDDLNMTTNRLQDYLKQVIPYTISFKAEEKNNININSIELNILDPISISNLAPLSYHYYNQTLHIPRNREYFTQFSEIMIHYLLLYNLSMICRYETEWISELLHTFSSFDYPYISNFLSVTSSKIPFLVYNFLMNNIR